MPTTVGVFVERIDAADALWTQCDGPMGRHADLVLQPGNLEADHVFAFGTPWSGSNAQGLTGWKRRWARMTGTLGEVRSKKAWERFARRTPGEVTVLFGDPPPAVEDAAFAAAKLVTDRVFAPDARATRPIVLPVTYHLYEDVHHFRAMPVPEKLVPLVAISSGAAALPGHLQRIEFFRKLRRAGVEFELFGRGLPADLRGRGPLINKSAVLCPAAMTLVIENYAAGEHYVSEKLWDPLLCWSLPIYFGSRAADSVIPGDAMVRLPDLGDAGVEVVKAAIADVGLYQRRLAAMAVARQRPLGDLRVVEFLRRVIAGDLVWPPVSANHAASVGTGR